jgi:hypothetical protein
MASEEFDILHPPTISLTTDEVLSALDCLAQDRLSVSAQKFCDMYRDGTLGCCPGEYADLLGYYWLIPEDHEILAKRKTQR